MRPFHLVPKVRSHGGEAHGPRRPAGQTTTCRISVRPVFHLGPKVPRAGPRLRAQDVPPLRASDDRADLGATRVSPCSEMVAGPGRRLMPKPSGAARANLHLRPHASRSPADSEQGETEHSAIPRSRGVPLDDATPTAVPTPIRKRETRGSTTPAIAGAVEPVGDLDRRRFGTTWNAGRPSDHPSGAPGRDSAAERPRRRACSLRQLTQRQAVARGMAPGTAS